MKFILSDVVGLGEATVKILPNPIGVKIRKNSQISFPGSVWERDDEEFLGRGPGPAKSRDCKKGLPGSFL
jgi:hypothetical protein